MGGLGGKIADGGHAELHPGGELVAGDAGGEFAVAGVGGEMTFVHLPEERARRAIRLDRNSLGGEMAHRVL